MAVVQKDRLLQHKEEKSIFLELGNWLVLLFMQDYYVFKLIQSNKQYFSSFIKKNTGYISKRMSFLVIIRFIDIKEKQKYPVFLSKNDRSEWQVFYDELVIAYRRFSQAHLLELAQPPTSSNLFKFAWRKNVCNDNFGFEAREKQSRQFLALALENFDEHTHLKIFGYLLFLSICWHVTHESLFLHSAGVVHKKKGFLFLGKSGAGKTTVARLSTSLGYPALGDDLNYVLYDYQMKGYQLAACPSPVISPVGYSKHRPPLRMIFKLVQDKTDYLVPLNTEELARALFDAFLQETPYVDRLPDDLISLGFRIACNIARSVPGFELHFRKSPNFWKLIDEKFPE